MNTGNVNRHVESITPLESPDSFVARMPVALAATALIANSRGEIQRIITGEDSRMLIVVGPCSIHDECAGKEYASRLARLANQVAPRILIVMRVYFEKPRTTIGWKGFINDPHLDETFEMAEGMERARAFLLNVLDLGLPTATEWLDPITPQYLADAIAWGAIGARTVESQTHRQLASGLSMPIGYKNGTGGTVQIAVDAIVAAKAPHTFLSVDGNGRVSIVKTMGNPDGHVVLRGGACGPNYTQEYVADAARRLQQAGLPPYVLIDCAHGNSNKEHNMQPVVFWEALGQRLLGNRNIMGMMLESNLCEGGQTLRKGSTLTYGVSITDPCIGWEATERLIMKAHDELGRRDSYRH